MLLWSATHDAHQELSLGTLMQVGAHLQSAKTRDLLGRSQGSALCTYLNRPITAHIIHITRCHTLTDGNAFLPKNCIAAEAFRVHVMGASIFLLV